MSCLLCPVISVKGGILNQLACGHQFCDNHLQEESKICPACLRRAPVSSILSERAESSPLCGGCLGKPSSINCTTCSCLYCVECDAFFHSKVFISSHHLRSSMVADSNVIDHSQLECACHLKPLLLYCTECEMRVCEDCVTPDVLSFRTTGRKGGGIDGGEVGPLTQESH